jgi:hypothetical protein
LMNSVLDIAREDYQGRMEIEELLTKWRETSYAPVNKADVLQKWLKGN